MKIQNIKEHRLFKKKENAKKTFEIVGYCKINKMFEATNIEDANDIIYIKNNVVKSHF